MHSTTLKPIYLLSDSQLLFNKIPNGQYYLHRIPQSFAGQDIKAVYIGASNNDQPEFFEIFKAGMNNIGIRDCTMIKSSFDSVDELHLKNADLILMAGGDSIMGWNVIKNTGMFDMVMGGYKRGVQLIGVSAGSMQLGEQLLTDSAYQASDILVDTMNLVPFNISAHDEGNNWKYLKKLVLQSNKTKKGIGIPFGAGAIFHSNGTIEAIGRSIYIFKLMDSEMKQEILEVVHS